MATSEESGTKGRARKSNWSCKDEVVLVEEVQRRESLLFGKLSGPGRTAQDKTKAWQEVASLVNAGNTSAQRNVAEIKKKYQNIKQKAKEKRSEAMRPKTGGGRRPPSPTASEQLLLDTLEGRPSMCGLAGGLDTAEPISDLESLLLLLPPSHTTSSSSVIVSSLPIPSATTATSSSSLTTSSSSLTTSSSSLTTSSSSSTIASTTESSSITTSFATSSSAVVTSDMLLREELMNIRERRKLIKDQQVLVNLQKHYLMLKIKQKDPFFDMDFFMSES